uniref:Uncharacterized protein n=1 Tax=Glossina pallidipes TaxID=7398 RepID=A0A1A9Z0D5_GLOPL
MLEKHYSLDGLITTTAHHYKHQNHQRIYVFYCKWLEERNHVLGQYLLWFAKLCKVSSPTNLELTKKFKRTNSALAPKGNTIFLLSSLPATTTTTTTTTATTTTTKHDFHYKL